MIDQVKTILQLDELDTDGHSPVKFVCDGTKNKPSLYYVKYRSDRSFKKEEVQCLVFEIVCTALLNEFNIPTPEIALVEITQGALNTKILQHNKRYLQPEIIAFGSKEIPGADIVKKIEVITKKTEFNKLQNPDDLIRIALFDLWVENADRWEDNLNLITSSVDKRLQFNAIDHGFAFGGLQGMNTFGPRDNVSLSKKLITSQYFRHIIQHIPKGGRLEIANNFISSMRKIDVQHIVNNVFQSIPQAWQIRPQLEGRIIAFLNAEDRISQIQQVALNEFNKTIKIKT